MLVTNYAEMVAAARKYGPVPVAVAAADDPEVLESVVAARAEGIVKGYLVGDQAAIEGMANRAGLDLNDLTVVHEPDHAQAARKVVALVREGAAAIVVKGQLKTAELLKPVLDSNTGLRDKNLLSHVAIFEIPGRSQLLYVSDSGVVLSPTLEQKLDIIRNVVDVAHRFGLALPKVAVLGASARVAPDQPRSVEAVLLSRMAHEGLVKGAIVEGPLPLDVAVNPTAAEIKGIDTAMAGTADILIVPSVDAGNIMCKAMQYFAGAQMAGMVVGARAPIIINSRADDARTRFLSLGMAVVWAAAGPGV